MGWTPKPHTALVHDVVNEGVQVGGPEAWTTARRQLFADLGHAVGLGQAPSEDDPDELSVVVAAAMKRDRARVTLGQPLACSRELQPGPTRGST
jgi:hypothetical protein